MSEQSEDGAGGSRREVNVDFAVAEGDGFEVVIRPHAGTRVVRLSSPAAKQLEDLAGATFDMGRVIELCRQYISTMDSASSRTTQDALWITALVLYARCFNKGVRGSLDTAVLDTIPGQAREVHDHFMDLRDKFIAHSVNVYEQTLAYAVMELGSNELNSSGTTHLWANPMNRSGAETLVRLAQAFYDDAVERQIALTATLREEVIALDSTAVAALPDLAAVTPTVAKGHRSRAG